MAVKIEIKVFEYEEKGADQKHNPRSYGSMATPQDTVFGAEQIIGKTFDVTVVKQTLESATAQAIKMLEINKEK